MGNRNKLKLFISVILILTMFITLCGYYNVYFNNTFIFADDTNLKSIENYYDGIDGAISAKAGFYTFDGKEKLVLPTKRGVYIISENVTEIFIETNAPVTDFTVIPDIDGDNVDDIVVATKNDDFPNVLAFSSKTGNLLWSYRNAEDYFDEYYYLMEKLNNPVLKMQHFYNSKEDLILFISHYKIIAIKCSDGSLVFSYEDKDNIWSFICLDVDINNNNYNDVIFGNQLGELKAIDGRNGNVIWQQQIVSDLEVYEKGKLYDIVSRSVWDIVINENDRNSILVTGEDGILYRINIQDGSIIGETVLIEFDEEELNEFYLNKRNQMGYFYFPNSDIPSIGLTDKEYFGFKLYNIGDVTGDNKSDYLVLQNLGFDFSYSLINANSQYSENFVVNAILINGDTLNNLWTCDITNALGDVIYTEPSVIEQQNSKYIIIPSNVSDNKIQFIAIDSKEGKLTNSVYRNVDMPKTSSLFVDYNPGGGYYHHGFFGGMVVERVEVVRPDFGKEPAPAELSNIRFILDKSKDGKIYLGAMDYYSFILDDDLSKVEGNYNTVFKGFFMPLNDGVLKVNGYVGDISDVSFINKNDLKEIWRFEPTEDDSKQIIEFLDVVTTGDINGDSVLDLIIIAKEGGQVSQNYQVLMVSGKDGKLITKAQLNQIDGSLHHLGDVNDDKIDDFLVISQTNAYRYVSNVNNSIENINYKKESIGINYSASTENHIYGGTLKDLNNDNIKDFHVVDLVDGNSAIARIYSGKDMTLLHEIRDMINVKYYFSQRDFNKDGVNDYAVYRRVTGDIDLVSGSDGSLIFKVPGPFSGEDWHGKPIEPAGEFYPGMFNAVVEEVFYPIKDVNGDGKPEYMVMNTVQGGYSTRELQIYDIENRYQEPLEVITLPAFQGYGEDYNACHFIKVGNDDSDYVLLKHYNNTILIDLEKINIICSFDADFISDAFLDSKDDKKLAIYGSDYKVVNFGFEFDVNVKEGIKTNSPVHLKWNLNEQSDFTTTYIYVNGILSAKSYGDNFRLQMSEGQHKIVLESVDNYGMTFYKEFEVDVTESSVAHLVLILLTLTSIVVLVILVVGPSFRMKSVLKRRAK